MNLSTTLKFAGSLVIVAIVAWPSVTDAQDWGSIRGPHFDGSAEAADAKISTGPLQAAVVWKRPFGSGYSGVVKSGDRIVSAMADLEAGEEFLVGMSADTGETIWKTPTGKIMKGANGSFDGPVATPAVDQDHAYHLTPFGDLAAYSLKDGSVTWSINFEKDFAAKPNNYGFGASPILYSDVLIVAVGAPDGAVMGFDPANGKVLWKAGEDGASFQTPTPMEIDGKTYIIAATNTKVFAIDPKDGTIAWTQPHAGAAGMPAKAVLPVPVPDGGVFLSDSKNQSTTLNLRSDGASERWSGPDIRNTFCVPVMTGGLLCSYSSRFLVAVDPKTGKRIWRSRTPSNGFVATLDGRLVIATMDGSLHIGDVSADGFQEVASTEVFKTGKGESDGLLWSLPTVAGKSVYLRSLGAIARVDIQSGDGQTEVATQESEVGPAFAKFLADVKSADDKQSIVDEFINGKSMPLIEDDYVQFVIQGDFQDVAVASDLFGLRQERRMQKVDGTNLFYFGVKVPEATRASYVYFADFKPIADPKNDRQFVSTGITGEMEPMFRGPAEPLTFSWFDKGEITSDLPINVDDNTAKLAGKIVDVKMDSKAMETGIDLSVYLPPGYADSDQQYPVVYVHDGQVALEQGNQAHIVDALIQKKQVRPAVVVFIRSRFFPMRGVGAYPQMFANELLPKIQQDYRISKNREDHSSMSGGFGATLALMTSLPASEQIGRIGLFSPFAFEMMHPGISKLVKMPNDRCDIFVEWGTYEFRNPSENWNMAKQGKIIADMLRDGGHQVKAKQTTLGNDWVCWRTQSVPMWKFLLGN